MPAKQRTPKKKKKKKQPLLPKTDMLEESSESVAGSTGSQIVFLIFLMLRLKSWKFLFWLLMLPVLFMNFITMRSIERRNPDNANGPNVKAISASSAAKWKSLISSSAGAEATAMEELMKSRGASVAGGWLTKCRSTEECQGDFVDAILAQTDSTRAFMRFEKRGKRFDCLDSTRADLICSYLFHLMSQSMDAGGASGPSVFKDVQFVKLFDKFETKTAKRERLKSNITGPDSLCTRTAKMDGAFFNHFPMYFMSHMMLVSASVTLYITVSTLSSVSGLKENGFLQLMFNSGLSVSAYWFVVWFITVVELLVISALTIISYTAQCPSFYSSAGLPRAFLILLCFFLFMASLGLLFTTVLASYFITLLLMIFLNIFLSTIVLLSRITVANAAGQLSSNVGQVKAMLVFPPGHIVEYMLHVMLPNKQNHESLTGYKEYYELVEILMLSVPVVLIIITIYLDFILKSGNGLCLPYGYPLNPNFWNPYRQKLIEMVDEQPKRANVEPTTGVPAVIANDIFMTYPGGLCTKSPTVLKGVTCTVYQGQITALIGHNGAGKTTLIRVLMGEEIPTSGLAVINGHRVTDPYQRLALRGTVSICKQVDVLSSCLTVMECMQLTLVAKGFKAESQVTKVLDMMKQLGLEGKENVQAMDLSGGQMRKVCSIICLLGNPRLVILDEPTSGLDPVSRRNLWQILQDHKAGRSIILCTQFMDEADILADRKMFLSAGKLICAGSSLFLKHAFGCCVTINVSLRSERHLKQLMKALKKATLVSQFQTELQLQVPAEKPKALAEAVQALEDHPELVDAFGVSQAQLDDIFMRLKDIDMDNIEASFKSKKLRKLGRGAKSQATLPPVDYSGLYNFESSKRISSSLVQQIVTVLAMNFSRQWKVKVNLCFRLLFPLMLIVFIALIVDMESEGQKPKIPPMPKDPSKGIVRVMVTDFGSGQFGACVFDQVPDEADKEAELERVNQACAKMFGATTEDLYKLKALPKAPENPMEKFLAQPDTINVFREHCSKVSFCFAVYASSWNQTDENRLRSVEVGLYTNPMDAVIPNSAAISIGYMLTTYVQFSRFFNAIPSGLGPNLTQSHAYTVNTFEGFTFITCYELLVFLTAFAIVPVTYLSDPIEDKDCGVRQHLASMGMSSLAYWLSTFLMHWMHYALFFLLSMAVCTFWDRYESTFFIVTICMPVLFLGTTSCQLSVYVVSALMRRSNAIIMVTYFFFAMILGITVIYLQDKYTVLMILTCLLPQIAPVVYMLISVKLMVYSMLFFDTKRADTVTSLPQTHASNTVTVCALVAMPVHIVVLIALIAIIEHPGALQRACASSGAGDSSECSKSIKDEGVKAEADRINKVVRNTANLLEVRDLQKVYPNGVRAVRGTTFGAYAGEILGLLGPNGAGKTTSMSIIVGEEAESSGSSEVHFTGTWMSGMEGAQCGAIGYCPQHNPLFNSISVFEHLRFYAQIRGIPAELAKSQIAGLIEGLGLKPHQEKASEQLSGGNKRRLCLAIALLGNPSLVVIDEASTGVDPENKRFIWSAIRGMASKQRSVMITTHSMEEVEALCARVGIMNKGVMIGFGTVQQLRSRHGEAYTLDVLMKAKKPRKLALKKKKLAKMMTKHFKKSMVQEDLMRSMQFFIPKKSVKCLSESMRHVIAKKKKLGIQYFSLYQMSLDQVFVKLVKEYDAAA